MPAARKPMRYGHTEGHTDVCFDDAGSCIVTCGSDGDVRIWENLDDDDPKSINVGEKAYSCALKNGRLITAVSNNTVQIHTFPEGAPDGILTRFTMNANHVIFNSNGTKIAAGSSDFMVKVVEVTDSSKQKTFRGHSAPVLSLSFDPRDVYLASASCDGSVRVWKIADQTCTTSWPLLQKCNDVINAKSICRLGWQPGSGKLLAIPVDKVVKLYRRETWDSQSDLSDTFITQALNVVAWSPCGQYLAAGSVDGCIVVWNAETQECMERMKHEKNYSVCGLAWHPKYRQIAYTDTEGNLGLLENIGDGKKPNDKVASTVAKDYNDLFDGEDDDYLNEDMIEPQSSPKAGASEDDGDGDDIVPTSGYPRRAIIDDDDNSLDIGMIKASSSLLEKEDDDDDQTGGVPALPSSIQQPLYDGPMPTPRQKPFQSGSTPVHLMHRFMVWNSVGIIRCYNDEQDNAIDIEFHDTSIHHATHLPNSLNHTMADLSTEAVLLACESTEELASKLHCVHFSSWDANKEWTVDMPKDEDVEAICLGQGWAACATSALLVRVFTVGGVQREIFSLPGPVVSMAGHGEQLMIIYHRGTGFDGDQCLGVQLMELGKKKKQILQGDPLSLTKRSYLVWVGFSAEGTPCYVDSEGIVRMLNRGLGNTWIPVCNMREHCKGKSDHYWVVGIHENPQQLRCIPCKGARFPPTLPRPAVAILSFKLPYCQVTTEKGQMEEQYWRSVVFHNHVDYLSKNGYELDENAKSQSVKEQQELLMKLFALSCKLEREFRCVELADLMTQNVVNLAVKYASRSRRLNLAQRLSEMAVEKASELATGAEDEEEEEDFQKHLNAGYSSSATEWSRLPVRNVRQNQEMEDAEETDACEEAEATPEVHKQRPNPFSKGVTSAEVATPKSAVIASSSQGRVNPFKVSSNKKDPVVPSANVLDTMSKYSKKTSLSSSRAVNKQNPAVIKPLIPKPKTKQALAASFFQVRTPNSSEKTVEEREEKAGNESHEVKVTAQENTENRRPKTGFQMWLEENRANILTDNPDLNEAEVIKEGMSRFRMLSSEERMAWTEKAKAGTANDLTEDKKRKRPTGDEDEAKKNQEQKSEDSSLSKKPKPLDQSTNVRLSAFAFKQS
ncbi:WD repeat and HMG-box DNA-binding protein 1 [Opisthocomus hoazin]|uniref:WD repeat and HMG-box DNA-binding protein 1 n=1 Tax=Opisthocomus hoazin TaxID=30419 RepID=A0A091WGE5_OPIHO|nr:PREDICTED: WD repeat and HMG-box DNA-binding protein 1 [Opisthocomus hoazin]KFR14644.1 WD repeat and HMG-box DNA-binding protein 1 [Opisthocomus hoazin]